MRPITCILSLSLSCIAPFANAQATGPEGPKPAPASPQGPRGERGPRFEAPEGLHVERDVAYATAKDDAGNPVELKLDAMFLKQSDGKPMPAIVFIHGGGFTGGSKDAGLQECVPLAMGGYFIASIDYRLAPASKFPAAVHDCKAAIRFLRKNASELGINPDKIGVWGKSAGGYLASMLGTTGNAPEMEGEVGVTGVSSAVQAVVAYCGPVDFATLDTGYEGDADPAIDHTLPDAPGHLFLGADPKADEALACRANPITYIDPRDAPIHLVHSIGDPIVPVGQSRKFIEALEAANVSSSFTGLPGANHNITGPRILLETATFFDQMLGGSSVETVRTMGKKPKPGAAAPATQPAKPAEAAPR
jgi:acetyl esterase/lipase